MATERLVALERDGTLKLYADDGSGPREVASLEVGNLTAEKAALVASALSDLRAAINNGQHEPARHVITPAQAGLPRGPARTKRDRHGHLYDLIEDYLRDHGPASASEIARGAHIDGSERTDPTKRTANALTNMLNSGRVGKLGPGRWVAL